MAAISICRLNGFDYNFCPRSKTHIKSGAPTCSLPFVQISGPILGGNCKPFTTVRLRCSYKRNKEVQQWSEFPMISCLMEDSAEPYSNEEQSSVPETSQKEVAIDLKLPRRSLLAIFTCNACGARSERLINRLAYERGLVYVQCSGCSQYHKLVDNLGLVVEYNLLEEPDSDTTADHI